MTIQNINVERVSALPDPLVANTLYFVKADGASTGTIYLTNNEGTIAATALTDNPSDFPAGGTKGQILEKNSATNFDASWVDKFAPFVNVLPDSGKLCVQPSTFSATAFKAPTSLSTHNSAAFSDGGTFIHDNTNFGGSQGSMNSQLVDLMNKLKSTDNAKRYGLVFRLANVSAISGTSGPVTFESETFYLNIFSTLGSQIVPKSTTRILIRALVDDFIIIKTNANNRIFVDGVEQSPAGSSSHVRITPAMGWVNLVIFNDNANDLSNSVGYTPEWFRTAAKPTTQVVFAGPALSVGHCHVPVGQTFLPSASNWS